MKKTYNLKLNFSIYIYIYKLIRKIHIIKNQKYK